MSGGSASHTHASAAELVRSMTRAHRVDSTHIRTVLAHMDDRRGVLENLLDHRVLEEAIKLRITEEASTVEAFACQLLGTSFHALTFSLRPNPAGPFPTTAILTPVETGRLVQALERPEVAEVFETARLAIYDTARRSTSVFDGTSNEEYLVQVPVGDATAAEGDLPSFHPVATEVTGLTTSMGLPLSFLHAPVAVPTPTDVPRGVTGPCLRFGVAFPTFDDSRRLRFGTRLVELCSGKGYGLWQRRSSGAQTYDYWDTVVPPPASGLSADAGGPGSDPATAAPTLAVTCVGPARSGTTEAVLRVLEQAGAPLVGLSETWLDDIALIHLLIQATLAEAAVGNLPNDLRADLAMSRALGLPEPVPDDRLRDYRALVSPRTERRGDPRLGALWLGWSAPATPNALELTVTTLRGALSDTAGRYGRAVGNPTPRDGHLNLEYLVCREVPSADRLQGRLRVAVDLDALGVTTGAGCRSDGGTGRRVSTTEIGRFCSDLERLWRTSLSFALGTAHVELDVVWRESWLGRWVTLRARDGVGG